MDQSNLPSPHNNFFHFALSHLPNARGLIQSQLPMEVLRELNLDTLEIVSGSFVASDLRDRHTDLLFSVKLAESIGDRADVELNQQVLVYFLLEHKSNPEPLTVLQLLSYIVRIWESRIREGLKLCPIIPLVVYHGDTQWKVARQIADLIPTSNALSAYQVQFGFPLLDLSAVPENQIPGNQLLQSSLGLLKYGRSNLLPEKLHRILELMGESIDVSIEVWIQAIGVYIMAVNKEIGSEELNRIVRSVFPTQIEPGSLADRLLIQGREEGMTRGMIAGRIQTLQELLGDTISKASELKIRTTQDLEQSLEELQARLRNRAN